MELDSGICMEDAIQDVPGDGGGTAQEGPGCGDHGGNDDETCCEIRVSGD